MVRWLRNGCWLEVYFMLLQLSTYSPVHLSTEHPAGAELHASVSAVGSRVPTVLCTRGRGMLGRSVGFDEPTRGPAGVAYVGSNIPYIFIHEAHPGHPGSVASWEHSWAQTQQFPLPHGVASTRRSHSVDKAVIETRPLGDVPWFSLACCACS